MPEAGQAGQHYTVWGHDKNLNVMWSGSICRIHGLPARAVLPRAAGITFILYVLISANEIVLEGSKHGVLRERHGSQAIARTSGEAVEFADHVNPED